MKKSITLTIAILFISFFSLKASEENNNIYYGNGYGKSYIFVVDNVEFSVFPDGQFDFTYLGNNTNVSFSSSNVNVSYNSGYNYEMYVQYDDYGGVIQIEEVPIYYDEFGRIAQAGDVEIRYSDRRIVRVGGLYVHYNYYGYYSHCTGYINPFNYYYVYRPWHFYYARPMYASCIVYDYPYRRYYAPLRYSYNDHYNYYSNRGRSNISYANGRRGFYKPGSRVHSKGGRSVANRDYNPNRRNNAVSNSNRRDKTTSRRSNAVTTRSTSNRTEKGNITGSNNSSSRRVASNNNSKSNRENNISTTRTQKTSYKRNVSSKKSNNSYSSSNRTKSTTNNNKSNRSYSNKDNSTKKIASNSQRKSSSKSTSNSRGTSSKRGRGL